MCLVQEHPLVALPNPIPGLAGPASGNDPTGFWWWEEAEFVGTRAQGCGLKSWLIGGCVSLLPVVPHPGRSQSLSPQTGSPVRAQQKLIPWNENSIIKFPAQKAGFMALGVVPGLSEPQVVVKPDKHLQSLLQ